MPEHHDDVDSDVEALSGMEILDRVIAQHRRDGYPPGPEPSVRNGPQHQEPTGGCSPTYKPTSGLARASTPLRHASQGSFAHAQRHRHRDHHRGRIGKPRTVTPSAFGAAKAATPGRVTEEHKRTAERFVEVSEISGTHLESAAGAFRKAMRRSPENQCAGDQDGLAAATSTSRALQRDCPRRNRLCRMDGWCHRQVPRRT